MLGPVLWFSSIRLIRDGEPRTATSTFTQLLSSVSSVVVVVADVEFHVLGCRLKC